MLTLLITGLWGSGKTMLASMVQELGVPMNLAPGGMPEDFEDEEMHYALTYYPQTMPIELIRARDALCPKWGFKHAAIWNDLQPAAACQVFRKLRVIILHRDMPSLHKHTNIPMEDLAIENVRIMHWARRLSCPTMHLSSELMFRKPADAMLLARDFVKV